MQVSLRPYNPEPRYGEDYLRLRGFLLELGDVTFPFGRWDWMISHSYLDAGGLGRIGMWFHDDGIVAVATYDTAIDGKCFFLVRPGYSFLYPDMIAHAEQHLSGDGGAKILIGDGDTVFQEAAVAAGYRASQDKDCDAVYMIDAASIRYDLPPGFRVTSMKETFDPYQYGRVLWKGFDHEIDGEGPFLPTPERLAVLEREFQRPNVNLELKIAVVAPDGDFASYSGMWHDHASPDVLVEPVATDPAYRGMGLARAAVLEGIRRCGLLGAQRAYVGSSQQFYYNIGFRPCRTSTFWTRKGT